MSQIKKMKNHTKTVEEIKKKDTFTWEDIGVLLGYKRTKASEVIKEILKVSNRCGFSRAKCHRLDYEMWLARGKEYKLEALNERLNVIMQDLSFSLKRTSNLIEQLLEVNKK